MTILNWQMRPEDVMIFSDTLCLDAEDKRPRNFMTKIFPAPHIGAIIAGTGSTALLLGFYTQAVSSMVVNDVVHLTQFSPGVLQEIWNANRDHQDVIATSTIYTFGLDKESGSFTGFAYRSTTDFSSEQLPPGVGVKPAPKDGQLHPIEDFQGFVDLAFKQQSADRAQPREERVGIGGDLWYYFMEKSESGDSVTIQSQRIARLNHFDDDSEIMLAKLPQNRSHPLSRFILAKDD